jgi:hypothetical protein
LVIRERGGGGGEGKERGERHHGTERVDHCEEMLIFNILEQGRGKPDEEKISNVEPRENDGCCDLYKVQVVMSFFSQSYFISNSPPSKPTISPKNPPGVLASYPEKTLCRKCRVEPKT